MSGYEFIVKIIGVLLSWPPVIAGLMLFFRKNVANSANNLLDRVESIKIKNFQAKFLKTTLKLLKDEMESDPQKRLSAPEKDKLQKTLVINSTPYYKLYANGIIVEHLKGYKILPATSQRQITFPCAFPNEITSIQIVGDIDARITENSLGWCKIAFTPSNVEREIQIIVSGI